MTLCPRCSSSKTVKNGTHLHSQRYRCKPCGYQYTRKSPRGYSPRERALALLLHSHGMSMNAIARLLDLSTPTVSRWIKALSQKTYDKPSKRQALVMEADKLWQYLDTLEMPPEFKKLILVLPVRSLAEDSGIVVKPLSCEGQEQESDLAAFLDDLRVKS